jgi:GNAT superfamily N-acetyltransferase
VATPGDALVVRTLIAAFRDHLRATTPEDSSIDAFLPTALSDPDLEFCCAFSSEGHGVGYTQTRFFRSVWVSGVEAQLEDLFVVPRARGDGVGRRLLDFALARAERRGVRAVGLNTNERNEPARRLYEKAGFRASRYAIWPGGHEIRMVKHIGAP